MPPITIVKDSDNDYYVYGDEITNDDFPVDGKPDDLKDYDLKYEWIDEDGNSIDGIPDDAGDYKVRITVDVPDDGNYNDNTTEWFDFTVGKRTITINAVEGQWKYYGTTDPVIKFTVEKAAANSNRGLLAKDSEDVGVYKIVLNTSVVLKNYVVEYDENAVTFEIKKQVLSNAMFQLDKDKFTYSGEKNIVHVITNLTKSDHTIEVKSTVSAVNAGEYNVYVTGKGNFEGEVVLPWRIKPVTVGEIFIIAPNSIPDDDKPITDYLKVVDSDNNELPDDIIDYIWYDAETNEEIPEPTEPGDYKVKAVIDDDNYDDGESDFIVITIEENDDTDSNNGNGSDTDNSDTESNSDNDSDTDSNSDTDNSDTDPDTDNSPDTPKKYDLIGDTDRNGKITARDSLYAQRAAVRSITLNDEAEVCADVDMDGQVTTRDALDILRYTINLNVKSHVGEEIDLSSFLRNK